MTNVLMTVGGRASLKAVFKYSYNCLKGGDLESMAEVDVAPGENIESVLKRFKKKIQKAGILAEIKRREFYEPPSVRRKRKLQAARKRRR